MVEELALLFRSQESAIHTLLSSRGSRDGSIHLLTGLCLLACRRRNRWEMGTTWKQDSLTDLQK